MERLVSEVSIETSEGHSAPSWPLVQLHLRSQRLLLLLLLRLSNVSALCVVCLVGERLPTV